jgi:hypothetical protein
MEWQAGHCAWEKEVGCQPPGRNWSNRWWGYLGRGPHCLALPGGGSEHSLVVGPHLAPLAGRPEL